MTNNKSEDSLRKQEWSKPKVGFLRQFLNESLDWKGKMWTDEEILKFIDIATPKVATSEKGTFEERTARKLDEDILSQFTTLNIKTKSTGNGTVKITPATSEKEERDYHDDGCPAVKKGTDFCECPLKEIRCKEKYVGALASICFNKLPCKDHPTPHESEDWVEFNLRARAGIQLQLEQAMKSGRTNKKLDFEEIRKRTDIAFESIKELAQSTSSKAYQRGREEVSFADKPAYSQNELDLMLVQVRDTLLSLAVQEIGDWIDKNSWKEGAGNEVIQVEDLKKFISGLMKK